MNWNEGETLSRRQEARLKCQRDALATLDAIDRVIDALRTRVREGPDWNLDSYPRETIKHYRLVIHATLKALEDRQGKEL